MYGGLIGRCQKWYVVAGTEVVRQENSKVAKHVPVLSMVDQIYNALTPKGVTMKVFGYWFLVILKQ